MAACNPYSRPLETDNGNVAVLLLPNVAMYSLEIARPERLALGLNCPKIICRVTRRRNPTPEFTLPSVVHVMDTPDSKKWLKRSDELEISRVKDDDAPGDVPVKTSVSKPDSQSISRISTRMPYVVLSDVLNVHVASALLVYRVLDVVGWTRNILLPTLMEEDEADAVVSSEVHSSRCRRDPWLATALTDVHANAVSSSTAAGILGVRVAAFLPAVHDIVSNSCAAHT